MKLGSARQKFSPDLLVLGPDEFPHAAADQFAGRVTQDLLHLRVDEQDSTFGVDVSDAYGDQIKCRPEAQLAVLDSRVQVLLRDLAALVACQVARALAQSPPFFRAQALIRPVSKGIGRC